MALDTGFVRSRFPALVDGFAYFDNAGGSLVLREVAVGVPTISFKVAGRDSAAIVAQVARDKVGVRHGDFHSRRLVEALGVDDGGGVLRASMVHYDTLAEVDRLVNSLARALA